MDVIVRSGRRNQSCVLTDFEVREIRELYEERGVTQVDLALRYSVAKGTISNIVHYKSRKDVR